MIQAQTGLAKKAFSAEQLLMACLDQIQRHDANINALVLVDDEKAMQQAKGVDQKISSGEALSPLEGIPLVIKDNICTAGMETTAGSQILKGYLPPYNATVARIITDAGGVLIGKSNLDEFGMGASTENSSFFTTKNPWDNTKVSGGSSGGSAAAVASDMCLYALGSDTGGSIRQPSAFCGMVGLKPSYGRVSRYGLIAYGSSLDTIGPLTKTVEDAALVLGFIAGHDKKDSTTQTVPVSNYLADIKTEIKGMKVGLVKEYLGAGIDDEVKKKVEQSVEVFKSLGAEVIEVSLPLTKYALAVYYLLAKAEVSSNLARYDGVRYGSPVFGDTLAEQYQKTRGQKFGPEVKRSIMMGTFTLSSGYHEAYYKKAAQVRTLIINEFKKAFDQVDCLIGPTTPTATFGIGEKSDPLAMYLADVLTVPPSVAGLPAVSVPCGFTKTDLPVGLQITGKPFDESTILRAAYNYEQATNWHTKKASLK